MVSMNGILRIPTLAAASVAVASFSADLTDRFTPSRGLCPSSSEAQPCTSLCDTVRELTSSWVPHVSISRLSNPSCLLRIGVPPPDGISFSVPNSKGSLVPGLECVSASPSSSLLMGLYQSAKLTRSAKPASFTYRISSSPSDVLYRWHFPEPKGSDIFGHPGCCSEKSRTVVVLLGWLGAKQKHLRRYAEWYTSRGFHVITFTVPIAEILSYQAGKTEKNIDLLVRHLADWSEEGKNLVFHTFSNTGWLTYGAILEKFQKQDPLLMGRIKGCIVDSAPVAAPDPQVWASGFSAAFLKKNSIATKGSSSPIDSGTGALGDIQFPADPKPAVAEAALQFLFQKFFKVVLNLPRVNRRLSDVLGVLSDAQPRCPQLYIYSSADRVIPVGSVECFIELQRRAGREVRACDFVFSPHVDHFRHDPKLYTSQLSEFLEDCVLTICKGSS